MDSVQSPNLTDQTEALKVSLINLAGELTRAALYALPPQSFEIIRDTVQEIQLTFRKIERRADYQRQFESVAAFTAAIRDVKTYVELAPIIASQIANFLTATQIAIILRDTETTENIVVQTKGGGPFFTGQRFASGTGLIGQVIATAKPYFTTEIGPQTAGLTYTNAGMALPLIAYGQTIGSLWLARSIEFSDSEIALMRVIADIAANALHPTKPLTTLTDFDARLKELETLKAKFINDMSHELRTPVTGLNMILYLLERNGDEKYAQYLGSMREDVERLTNLSESILDATRLETRLSSARFEPVDFNAVVTQLADIYQTRAQRADISWSFEAVDAPLPIKGDQTLLIKAVGNLLTNAISYALHGKVIVRTALDGSQQSAKLIVENTGIGIDPIDLPHLFERFYRGSRVAESSIPGAGLGLFMVKEIIDLHQGRIEVESAAEDKTRFTVHLPLIPTGLPA